MPVLGDRKPVSIIIMSAVNLGFLKGNIWGGKVYDCSSRLWLLQHPWLWQIRNIVAQCFLGCRDPSVGLGFAKMWVPWAASFLYESKYLGHNYCEYCILQSGSISSTCIGLVFTKNLLRAAVAILRNLPMTLSYVASLHLCCLLSVLFHFACSNCVRHNCELICSLMLTQA